MTPALSRSLAGLLLFLIFATASVFGHKAARAALTGTASDPVGAVISGATVIATQQGSNIRRETVTNGDGLYDLSDMAPGDYELRVEALAFNPNVSKMPVSLKVDRKSTINVSLTVNTNDPRILCVLTVTDGPGEIERTDRKSVV